MHFRLNSILADCRVAFNQMTDSEKASAPQTLFGKNAMSAFLAMMNAAGHELQLCAICFSRKCCE